MTVSRLLTLLLLTILLFHCEDPVELPSRFESPELVVEAWLSNESAPQTIILTETQDFYDNRLPTPVTDAQVAICETIDSVVTSNCFLFEYADSGRYVWTPALPGQTLGEVGTQLGLGIQRGEEQYASVTTVERTAVIDSLSYQFEEEQLGLDEGFYAQLYARDQPGQGDAYLIRSTFNDTLLLNPEELNVAFDATFSPGNDADGITFIFPIRFRINYTDADGAVVPVEDGDTYSVEVIGLSEAAYLFLRIAAEQVNNGQSGLFDLPVANSPSNILNVTTERPALGFFNVGEVARISRTFEN